ncbi:hypothetical protein J2X72_000975 [Phyllobacterium sp. 1468]|nr:hypothetical protein [Phyllobacterium sp. 1468]
MDCTHTVYVKARAESAEWSALQSTTLPHGEPVEPRKSIDAIYPTAKILT